MALYLVSGVAGFIGSSIAEELIRRGERVRGIDNLSTGKRENLSILGAKLEFIEGDINDAGKIRDACRGVDYIFHEAAIPSVPRSVADPMENNRANADGTLSLLIAARDARVRRVVYASTSAAYGDDETLPKRESMLPRPISPYAASKLAGEYYTKVFYRVYGLETVALRYFNVFGPRQDPTSMYSGVLAKFIPRMLRGERPTIYGDGTQTRDFVFVQNVVHANLLACHAPASAVTGKTFNVATGQSRSLNEMYRQLRAATGFDEAPQYGPPAVGDIPHSVADISLAASAFGYQPSVSFEEGLRRTVDWYAQSIRANSAPSQVRLSHGDAIQAAE